MKRIFLVIAIIGLFLYSCRKSGSVCPDATSLGGGWRMITVKEIASGLTTTKPSFVNGDVDITFTTINTAKGIFTGNTPTNEIGQSDYLIGENQTITILNLAMTKVMETSWGKEFVDNIRNSREYGFEIDGRLNIKTTNKILTFRKR